MRTLVFVAICVGGLAAGYHWCLGKVSYSAVSGGYSPSASGGMAPWQQDRMLKNYRDRAVPYDMTVKTERKGQFIVTTTTYTPKKPE